MWVETQRNTWPPTLGGRGVWRLGTAEMKHTREPAEAFWRAQQAQGVGEFPPCPTRLTHGELRRERQAG